MSGSPEQSLRRPRRRHAISTERRTRVEVVRSGRWWAITVPEIGRVFSQARRLDQVEDRAREALALLLDIRAFADLWGAGWLRVLE